MTRAWSETELKMLADALDTDADMAQVLSRTAAEIKRKRIALGLPHGRPLEALRKQAEAEAG